MNSPQFDLNCDLTYLPNFMSEKEAKDLYLLMTEEFKIQEKNKLFVNGIEQTTEYSKLMFLDVDLYGKNLLPQEFWGASAPFPPLLLLVLDRIEEITGRTFKVCVCIYYPDGNSGVDYHSDYPAFGDTSIIPSLSLGEEREFYLREKTTQKELELKLKNGSLVIMGENCQDLYEHALPKNPAYKNPRINLTFRQFGYQKPLLK
jgi:alkylated DNA repair dioxygenase AlkB